MKKFLVLFVVVFFISLPQSNLKAQAFQKGDMVANLGVGFGWYGYGALGGVSSLPAFSLSLEKGIAEINNVGPFSIGGIVGFKHASYSAIDWSQNDIIIAARGAIHYDLFKNDKVDTYGGLALGARIYSQKETFFGTTNKANFTTGLFALYIGGRYYFSDTFAGFGELGYGLGYLTLGVSKKF